MFSKKEKSNKIKVLHIGNIAGNGYNNAKFLRKKGIEADLLIYNYTYAMGQPEWEDVYFEEEVDEWNPNWNQVNLQGFKRPKWVSQYCSFPLGKIKFISHFKEILKMKRRVDREFNLQLKRDRPISKIKIFKQKINNYILQVRSTASVMRSFREQYFYIKHLRRVANHYDIIQAYGLDPIIVMLSCPDKPLVSYEHGTMRDIPLEGTLKGELLKLAYRKSKKCIITNPDGILTAKKIGLKNYVFIPHPVDTEEFSPRETILRNQLIKKTGAELIFFAPARHDWDIKGNYKIIDAFYQYIKEASKKPVLNSEQSEESRFCRAKRGTVLIFSNWGGEVDKSKNYIKKLGIEKYIIWTSPLPKMKLAEYYNASDLVLDQFRYGHFGTTSPEAMACAKPVINQFDWQINKWAWPEKPPLIPAQSSEEIFQAMKRIAQDEKLKEILGKRGRIWMEKYHNWQLVAQKQIDIYKEILTCQKN